MRVFGREKERAIQKEIEGNELQIARGDYIGLQEGIKEMVVDRYRYRGGVEEQSIKCKNRSSIYPSAIEEAGAFSIYPPGIEKLSRLRYEEKLKELDRQLTIEKVLRR